MPLTLSPDAYAISITPGFYDKLRGNLYVVEDKAIGEIHRVFWISNVPRGGVRGEHSLKNTVQHFVAVAGQVTLYLAGSTDRESIDLDSPDVMVSVAPDVWRSLTDFSDDAVVMVLCSHNYDAEEYVRNEKMVEEYKNGN